MFKNIKGQYHYTKLHEFVGPIVTSQDHEILATWKAHFKSVKVPYIVIERKVVSYLKSHNRIINAKFLVCERLV